jgi:general secretion pathway protein A
MYERFFGLVDAPFRLTPDPRYLFLSRKHAEALAHLKLGLSESSGFVCITGDVGTGKTTLLRSFLTNVDDDTWSAYIFNPSMSAIELLQTINAELGIPSTSDSQKVLVDALNKHLLMQRQAQRRSVVVIDEAQALSIDVLEQLRLLSNLETTTEKLLRIVLVGQPQLRTLLAHSELAQLNQRITLRWHMGPLAYRETVAYMRHRLAIASDGEQTNLFTRAAIWQVHRLSHGIPRLINMIAHRALLAAFAADQRTVTARSVLRAYREIGALPLTGAAPAAPAGPRRLALAATALAVVVGAIALGLPRLGALPGLGLPHQERSEHRAPAVAPSPAPEPEAPAPAVAAPAPSDVAPAPVADVPPAAEAREAPAVAAGDSPPPPADAGAPAGDAPPPPPADAPAPVAGETAPAPAPTPEPAPAVAALEPAAPPVDPGVATAAVEQRLAALDPHASARAAVQALLAAWHARPLDPGEPASLADLTAVATRRGLEPLPLQGNGSMLRLLDLPAVLELRVPAADGPRFATLTTLADGRATLVVGDEAMPIDDAFLDRYWFGQAYLLWRDFEALGPAFGREGRGLAVARLQGLLGRTGLYAGGATGTFDAATAAAVLAFQRSRFLVPDGRVGKLTRIVLYSAAGGYARPMLHPARDAAS